MRKVYNFGAGPAMLPEDVLLQAQSEMLDWHGTGMSIMELGHRGSEFAKVAEQSETDLRELLDIPKNYHVLFLAGGASVQFAMVPINLLTTKKSADYINTGIWSEKAINEAKRYGSINVAAELKTELGLVRIPAEKTWSLNPHAAYVHYTANETIAGIEFHSVPKTGNVPLVVDMTSNILSRPLNVSDYGIIYAGAQKNMGQAGLNIVIIRDDLVTEYASHLPTLYSYKVQVENKSLYNTSPTYAWYISGLVFAWMKRKGGLNYFAELNKRKAEKLYKVIDMYPDFYVNHIHPDYRSIMNVPFDLKRAELIPIFLDEAKKRNLVNLKGHRLAGGVRASIYNAMPEEGVDKLVEFMDEFVRKNG
jgi:phosphoserine aminotransferase